MDSRIRIGEGLLRRRQWSGTGANYSIRLRYWPEAGTCLEFGHFPVIPKGWKLQQPVVERSDTTGCCCF